MGEAGPQFSPQSVGVGSSFPQRKYTFSFAVSVAVVFLVALNLSVMLQGCGCNSDKARQCIDNRLVKEPIVTGGACTGFNAVALCMEDHDCCESEANGQLMKDYLNEMSGGVCRNPC